MWSYLVVKIYVISDLSCHHTQNVVGKSLPNLLCRCLNESRPAVDLVEQPNGYIGKIGAGFINVAIILSISSD